MGVYPSLGAAVLIRLSSFRTGHFGPHASLLLDELRAAANSGLPVTCIVLAHTLVDVIANEQAGPAGYLDGMVFAYAGNKAALLWLRGRRNLILHHEGPSDGLMGEASAAEWLIRDAEKAILTVLDYLADLDNGG